MWVMATKSPLGQLIHSARAPEKLSLQDIADRASKRGIEMSKQNVSRLANDYPLASVSGAQIRGLALALGISERRVAAAALAALGLKVADEATPLRQAILDADEVGERTKRILLTIIAEDTDERSNVVSLPQRSPIEGHEPPADAAAFTAGDESGYERQARQQDEDAERPDV
jgi:transcriptional regulator with XRE-family HTH domain